MSGPADLRVARRPGSAHGIARRLLLIGAASLVGAALPARATAVTASDPAAAAMPRLQVVASFSILADIARQLAAGLASVQTLAGANADAHSYQPTPSDVQRLVRADLILVNGLGFEPWLDRVRAGTPMRGSVVVASQGVDERRIGPVSDPHAWLSPLQGRHYVDNIEAALVQALGATTPAAATVRRRAAELRERLALLDRDIRRALEPVPPEARRVITTHGSFGYFGRDYGLVITPLVAGAGETEASAGQMARVIRQIRAQRAVALFSENTVDARLLQRVADEAGVSIGGTLYGDALSDPDGPAPGYLQLVAHNARTLTDALRRIPPKEITR